MNFQFRNDYIVTLGDTHKITTVNDILVKRAKELQGLDVFHIGDVGLGGASRDIELREILDIHNTCAMNDIELYLIRGNHDNPAIWDDQRYAMARVHFVQDYSTLTFPNGKKALAVGGGISVDRARRTYLLSYWDDEVTPPVPFYIEPHDYVFAHDCPNGVNASTESLKESHLSSFLAIDPLLEPDLKIQRGIMDDILRIARPKRWVFGHYHNDKQSSKDGCRFTCIDINEAREFIAK